MLGGDILEVYRECQQPPHQWEQRSSHLFPIHPLSSSRPSLHPHSHWPSAFSNHGQITRSRRFAGRDQRGQILGLLVTSVKLEQQCRRENGGAAEAEEQAISGEERGELRHVVRLVRRLRLACTRSTWFGSDSLVHVGCHARMASA
jgi:hypothetical protein